ncbi:hypothetical protein TREES_T100012910 [Tupaia chinensis]|uniref:Uncharacterized protein n=1 Tax=Tupaia chinensis TaxID=246437 RepID=L9L8P7_TUPCH|nr:hypothetical protein TREES_T100012910 [Tupaia chinensis]
MVLSYSGSAPRPQQNRQQLCRPVGPASAGVTCWAVTSQCACEGDGRGENRARRRYLPAQEQKPLRRAWMSFREPSHCCPPPRSANVFSDAQKHPC